MNKIDNLIRLGQNNSIKLAGRIQMAEMMGMPEDEFSSFVRSIESSELFKMLCYSYKNNGLGRLIRFRRRPRTAMVFGNSILKEDISEGGIPCNLEEIIANNHDLIQIIKRIGIQRFKEYFLYCDSDKDISNISTELGISEQDVLSIVDLVNSIYFTGASSYGVCENNKSGIRYLKLASIIKEANGFSIGYFDICYARGRYIIDYDMLKTIATHTSITYARRREIFRLIKTLEMIDSRRDLLHRMLQYIIKKQELFIVSGDISLRVPLTQKQIAKDLGVSPSTINRAIRLKSIELPSGEDIPLKAFFPSRSTVVKTFVYNVVCCNKGGSITDTHLADMITEKFDIRISRRSVNNYRREVTGWDS